MADTLTIEPAAVGEIEAVNTDERRNLLADQLDKVETVQQEEPQEPAKTDDRPRGPDGKFAPKTEAKADIKADAGPKEPAPLIEDAPWKKPPQSWKKEAHPHWEKLTPEVAQYVHEREQQMRAGIEQAIPKVRAYDTMLKTMQPFAENIRIATGGTSDQHVMQAVKGLMEADHILRTSPQEQKRAYLFKIAQAYGINLGDVSDAPQVSPQLFELNQKIAQLEANITAERTAKEEAEQRSLLESVQEFATKHEHFETLRPTMIRLLNAGEAKGLEDAYTKAMRLNDELFEAQQQALQAQQAQERMKTKDASAKAARNAAVSVRSSTPGSNTAPKAQDRRSMLAEQFSEQDGRL